MAKKQKKKKKRCATETKRARVETATKIAASVGPEREEMPI